MHIPTKTTIRTGGNGHSNDPVPPPQPGGGPRRQPRRLPWWVTLLWVIGLGALAAYIFWPRPQLPAEPVDAVNARRMQGSPDAPVTVEMFSDFNCSSCRQFHESGVLRQVLEAYPGQVRFIWRDFPVLSVRSVPAAEAALCASDQGAFWAYHDALYANYGQLADAQLSAYAQDLGLDAQAFQTCRETRQHWPEVQRDLRAARLIDLPGPPVFAINGRPILAGPATFDQFQRALAPLLTGPTPSAP